MLVEPRLDRFGNAPSRWRRLRIHPARELIEPPTVRKSLERSRPA
jgi:hypothetical protein